MPLETNDIKKLGPIVDWRIYFLFVVDSQVSQPDGKDW